MSVPSEMLVILVLLHSQVPTCPNEFGYMCCMHKCYWDAGPKYDASHITQKHLPWILSLIDYLKHALILYYIAVLLSWQGWK